MKSEYQQKVQKFKKTSPFSQNLFIESMFLNESTAPLATILLSKRFHSERILKVLILFISDTNLSEEFQKCEVKN